MPSSIFRTLSLEKLPKKKKKILIDFYVVWKWNIC